MISVTDLYQGNEDFRNTSNSKNVDGMDNAGDGGCHTGNKYEYKPVPLGPGDLQIPEQPQREEDENRICVYVTCILL
jgi:hypothetical protein